MSAFGSIQIGGLASGLDTSAIIRAIMSFESRPMQLMEGQKARENSKISLWGTLKGLVTTLQDKAKSFTSDTGSIFAHKVEASQEGIASFSVTGSPQSESHSLFVTSLASANRYGFDGVADATVDQGAGTVSFDYGTTNYSVAVAADASSLNEIAAAINAEADVQKAAGGDTVTASVINTGTSSSPSYQLVIAGDDTGTDFAITNLATTVAGVINPTELTAASNAEVTIDGLTVSRSNNVFSDVVDGISFTVTGTSAVDSPMTFSTSVDVEGTQEKFQEFIDEYNKVINFVNDQNKYSEEGGPGGDLFGDYGLNRVTSEIKGALFDIVDVDDLSTLDGYSTLSVLGISVGNDGTLSIDEDEFAAKMTEDPEAFEAFFVDSTTGIFETLDDTIKNLVDGGTDDQGRDFEGFFSTKTESLGKVVKSLDKRIEQMSYNLEKLEERLVAQYANLEALMTQLNSQGSALMAGMSAFA